MGLFSWLVEKACDFIDYLSEKTEEILENTVGRFIDWISGSNDLNDAPPYKPENATIDETAKYNELLTKKRNEFSYICINFEKTIMEEAENIFTFFNKTIKGINEQLNLSISVMLIKNEFEEYKGNLKGGISTLVNRRLALSDNECAKILGRETGEKRSTDIDSFLKIIVREGSQKYLDNFDKIISRAIILVKDNVKETYSERLTLEQKAKEELEELDRDLSTLETKVKREEFDDKIDVLSQSLSLM
jgi:hypothetical protein